MSDTFSPSKRREIMARITGKNTIPEIAVRKILYGLGYRYRLHVRNLPGKPDIVIRKLKTIFLINGCFWHQHPGCKRRSVPKSNLEYWNNKLKANIRKQKQDINKLKKLGWNIHIIWECETKKYQNLLNKIKGINEKINKIQIS